MATGTKVKLPQPKVTLPIKADVRNPTIAPKPKAPPSDASQYQGMLTGANKQYQITDPVLLSGFAALSPEQQTAYRKYYTDPGRDRRVTILPGMWGQLGGNYSTQGAPPATPAPAPQMPWDTQYEQSIGGINRTKTTNLADIGAQESQLGSTYGYSYDPVSGAVAADPSNPFSRAALLKQNYDRSKAGTTNSMAARGQLYAGATQNAQNVNDLNYSQSSDALQRDFSSQALGFIRQRHGVEQTAQDATDQAGWTRLGTSLANAQANPQDPGPAAVAATTAGAGGSAPAPKAPLGGLPSNAGKTVVSQLAWLKKHPVWLASADGKKWAAGHPVAIGALK